MEANISGVTFFSQGWDFQRRKNMTKIRKEATLWGVSLIQSEVRRNCQASLPAPSSVDPGLRRMRRQHEVSLLASLPTFPPSCPRRLPLYPLSHRKYLRIILPFAPSISPPACVRRSGWGHKVGQGSSPFLLFLSSDSKASETPALAPQQPGPCCHGNGASPRLPSGPLSLQGRGRPAQTQTIA